MSLISISEYNSSEEDEVKIPKVSESEKKRLPRPSLPSFGVNNAVRREPKDDRTNHQNRKRTFKHEAGNWATYVAVPIASDANFEEYLERISNTFRDCNLNPTDDLHVSLTRVLVLRHHWIEGFVDSIKKCLLSGPFIMTLRGLSIYVNEDKSRTFVGLKVERGRQVLNEMVEKVDKCLTEYSLEKFYTDRSFHVSILWGLGDLSQQLKDKIPQIPEQELSFHIFQCICKSGNKLFCLPLQ